MFLEQGLSPEELEIVAVDDGSTDKTPSIIQKFVPRLKHVRKKNGGQASAFNARFAEAHGLRCEVHCTTMGFMDMANLHVSCAIQNCEFFELLVPEEPFRFPMKDPYPIDKQGIAHVPKKPGIGVELDWDAIDRTCVEHKVTKAFK